MLSLRSINQFYGQNHILWDVDLDLQPGTCTGIIGQPGMGKTTLVNCIMGHLPINSGSMIWQEDNGPPQDLLLQPVEKRASLGIGYVPQGRQIFSQMTIEENLQIALLAGAGMERHRAIPPMVYDLFPALYSLRHQRSGELPIGQQQQLALARALVLQPKLLILDEPTEGMSPWLEEEMGNLIHRLNHDFGMTILLLEQRLSFIRRVADYFLLLHRGRNVAHGKVAQLDDSMVNTWLTV
ncbi:MULTISPECIES: ABC transporter ATP-binding protein [Erwinia]|uniref:ABC transporter ATP-binding protein n=1 Tax=Erwinia rhapontici TaxID=55212 RepID=A0ABM7MXU9_ERWRD|nr:MULTISPECIES: ATP-binding cassette domain-containing protein [Erwinia]MBP2154774.1 ABC-type branched-subunit amino acid transport system ATPase component [Erwinia rhapontici]MCS3609394.1 ABC-type branched-subunit amino acid transport system ATPase component [Erwinia rhapontici]NKG31090.1 ATP-binding cassette domain-containing protein [Erwinia rhapontici]NNS08350.1 ATP-binding cassette domain-containing protein [Erwinia sp. JH02]TDT01574.1 amino acid/amide ABC transporter ATP-binding protein